MQVIGTLDIPGGESIKSSLAMKLMILTMSEFTVMAVPLAVISLLTMDPCSPPFLLSMSPSCRHIDWATARLEISIVLFEAGKALQIFSAGSVWVRARK